MQVDDCQDADWFSGAIHQQGQNLERQGSRGRTKRWHRLSPLAVLALLGALTATACSGVTIGQQPPTSVQAGTHSVPLQIVGGPGGSTIALVPVYIRGQGPFPFALDTGASQSVVDLNVVQQLNIPITGDAGRASGVGGLVPAKLIRVDQWRVGDVPLSPGVYVTIDLPEPNGRSGLQGLLGSDILSNFHVITVNYQREVLTLGPLRASPSP